MGVKGNVMGRSFGPWSFVFSRRKEVPFDRLRVKRRKDEGGTGLFFKSGTQEGRKRIK